MVYSQSIMQNMETQLGTDAEMYDRSQASMKETISNLNDQNIII